MSETIREQIMAVRATGRANMLDIQAVFEIAFEFGFMELCDFIFMDTRSYSNFILTGEREE